MCRFPDPDFPICDVSDFPDFPAISPISAPISDFPEVDQRVRLHLLGDPAGNDLLGVHQKALSNRWVTRMPGVLTESGEMTPTGTIVCGSAMTTSAASAITGLKLCAVSEYSRLP